LEKLKNSKVWKVVVTIQEWLLMILGVGVVMIVASTAILASIFDINFPGNEELLIIVVFYLYMIGCSYGAYEKSHITAEIIDVMIKEGIVLDTIRLVRWILTFILGIVFMAWAFSLVQWSLENELKTLVYRIPIAFGQFSILLGLFLTNIYNFVHMYDEIKGYIAKRKHKTAVENGSPEVM